MNEINLLNYFRHLWKGKYFYLQAFLIVVTPILLYAYLFFSEKYEVSMTLKPYEINDRQSLAVNSFFGSSEQSTPEFTKFKALYKSPDLAQRLISSSNNPMKYIYKYDDDGNHISSLSSKIKSLVYFRKLPHVPDRYDLSEYISNVISLDYDDISETYIFSMTHQDVAFAKEFLENVFLETDAYIAELDEIIIQSRLEKLKLEIDETRISEVKTSISEKIASDLIKKSLLDSNLNYSAQIISNVGFSKYPVSPNFFSIFIFSSLLGLGFVLILSTFRISLSKD
jgi:LPS O-antigen subunit length determinant protein (WzzB/FepE family)